MNRSVAKYFYAQRYSLLQKKILIFLAHDEVHVCISTGIDRIAQKMDSEHRQSLENILLIANDIGKLMPGVHWTFHAGNVL